MNLTNEVGGATCGKYGKCYHTLFNEWVLHTEAVDQSLC